MTLTKSSGDAPSIIDQAREMGWNCGIFDFGKAKTPDVDYFNSGLVDRPDGRWLVTRRCYKKVNSLIAFLLDGNKPVRGFPVRMEQRFTNEHFEDPRVIYHNGKTYVSACNFILNKTGWSGAHQIICEVNNDWTSVKRYDPEYGGNGFDSWSITRHEKNWIWFFDVNCPHLVYSASPHRIARFNMDFEHIKNDDWLASEYTEEWNSTIWRYGDIRGGTPPVLVGSEYYTFFHSSTLWRSPKRQYHMGCYSFSKDNPNGVSFAMKSITLEPLLSGSISDRWKPGCPIVCFPCGSIFKDGIWTITGGCNDLDTFWCDIPHDILVNQMIEI